MLTLGDQEKTYHGSVDKRWFHCYDITVLGKFFQALLNIVYPAQCLICQNKLNATSIGTLLCQNCWSAIKKNPPPFCVRCGRHLEIAQTDEGCPGCKRRDYSFDRAIAPCIYEGVLKELIHRFKYNGQECLGELLAGLMTGFIKEYNLNLGEFDFVVPVPLHRRKLREREFNQAELLARPLAKEFNLVLSKEILIRQRDTATQTELSEDARWRNVRACFLVNPQINLKDKNILLIDDLLTTGATCSEAAAVIKKAGGRKVWALTLAN